MVKKSFKIIICLFIVLLLSLQSSSTVLAAIETATQGTRAVFGIEQLHESDLLDRSGSMKIGYRVDGKNVYRVYYDNNNERDFETTIVCLDKNARFPATTDASGRTNRGNYTSLGEANQTTLHQVKGSIDSQGAKRMDWLIKNALLPEDGEALSKQKVAEAFDAIISATATDVNPVRVEDIRSTLTKDDLVIALQLAVWNITNNVEPGNIAGTWDGIHFDSLTGNSIFSEKGIKGTYIKYLYGYYVSHWDDTTPATGTNPVVSKPAQDNTEITLDRIGMYVYVGPFKIDEATNFYTVDVSFKDADDQPINTSAVPYIITDKNDGTGTILTQNKEGLNGKEFYIRVRANSTAKAVTVTATPRIQILSSVGYVWQGDGEGDQPLLSIEREPDDPQPSSKTIKYTPNTPPRHYDASLRKSIVGYYLYDDDWGSYIRYEVSESESRLPKVTLPLTKDRQYNEFAYNHRKDPYKTQVGAQIIYEIRVYNEGDEPIRITSITDNLPPVGLRMPTSSGERAGYDLNQEYGWVYNSSTNSVTTQYGSTYVLEPAPEGSTSLNYRSVEICLVVTPEAKGKIITNIAEITGYETIPTGGKDSDSGYSTNSDSGRRVQLPSAEIDWELYNGYLNRDFNVPVDEWYKGQEDDDDFEKIEVPADKQIDLALRKSIYEISGKDYSREKKPDTTPLNNNQTTSNFTDVKDPITVKVGDKVKYRIRVFNEGDQDGYANKIEDYLPKGLGYLPDYTTNIENEWQVDSSSGETTLGEIENATSNFTSSEFRQGVSVENAVVKKGQATISSTKLQNETLVNYVSNGDLDIHSLEVVCVVLDEVEPNTIIKNISAITQYKDATGARIEEDRDSNATPINPTTYPENDHIQDDDDFEKILYVREVKAYDLALKKFITKVTSESGQEKTLPEAQRRYCQVENTDSLKNREAGGTATATYSLNKTKVDVQNHDTVVYTIRVFNEGRQDAKVTKLIDTVPTGLAFITDSQINRDNGWSLFEDNSNTGWKQGIVTEKLKNDVIPAFDNSQANGTNKEKGLSYRDVQVEFKVLLDEIDDSSLDAIYSNGIRNEAEIMDDDGVDNDSTPNNAEGEDDLDYDIVIPPAPTRFDLALKKFIISINDGETVPIRIRSVNSDNLARDGHDASYDLDKTVITVKSGKRIVYAIRVYNEGTIDGYVKELRDTLPEGLSFISPEDSRINATYGWRERDGQVYTRYLENEKINAYDSENRQTDESRQIVDGISYKEVQIELMMTSKDPSKVIKNEAEITEDSNDREMVDPDSEPGNNIPSEDDQDYDNVQPEVNYYDLALKKSITTVTSANGTVKVLPEDQKRAIEVISTNSLINRGAKADAQYKLNKTPVGIEDGDSVIYTIRIFNEGSEDAKVGEIIDNVPKGLKLAKYETNSDGTYKSGSKTNSKYGWKERAATGTDKLSGVSTDYLKDTVIPKFDSTQANGTNKEKGLSYVDVQIEFVVDLTVLTDDEEQTDDYDAYYDILENGIKNIAEITKDDGDDSDSTPDNNIPEEDDEDYDIIKPGRFDLALVKFITQVDNKKITDREPEDVITAQNAWINKNEEPVTVVNGQVVTYTIRIYNEGSIDGYAEEITDDLPEGITFLPEHETNQEYRWKMLDSSGNVTTDVKKAVKITTDYLSKDNEKSPGENLIKKFVLTKDDALDYKDVQVAFKVTKNDPTANPKVIINTAEISEDADENGNPVEDVDSKPGNNDPEEDDIDREFITLKYFDLSLLKYISEVVVTEDGKEKRIVTNYTGLENPEPIVKIELDKKKRAKTAIKYIYTIKITNEGEIEGYAKEVKDRIPEGLAFDEKDNTAFNWKVSEDGTVTTDYLKDKLLKPGESAEVKIVLSWINRDGNYGLKTNVAEISKDENEYGIPDIDSTPNNNKDGEDDQDNALSLLLTNTGAKPIYLTLIVSVIAIAGSGLYLIKRYVL